MSTQKSNNNNALTPKDRIRLIRQRLNLSQNQFALEMGTSARSVQLWESGDHTPRGKNAEKLNAMFAKVQAAPPDKERNPNHSSSKTAPAPVPVARFRHWNAATGKKEPNEKVDAFLLGLVQLCREHGFVVVPEDDTVELEVRPFSEPAGTLLLHSQTRL